MELQVVNVTLQDLKTEELVFDVQLFREVDMMKSLWLIICC